MTHEINDIISEYARICSRLKTAIENTRRRSQRIRAYVSYVIETHDLQYSVYNSLRGEKISDELREVMDQMSSTVEDLLSKSLASLEAAVRKERGFIVYSADDDDFANKVGNRCGKCIEDIEKANGVYERVDAVRECISDLRDMFWQEVERGMGGGKGGH